MFATGGSSGRFPNQYPSIVGSPDGGAPPGGGYPGGGPPDGGPPGGYPGGRPLDGGEPPRVPGGQGPPGPQGPAGPVRPIIVQTPQITLDTTALESTFDTVGQSMMQLARAQDQTNRQLQQHIQQGQVNIQAHTGALHQLTTSTYQKILTTYLPAFLYMMGVIEKDSFLGSKA